MFLWIQNRFNERWKENAANFALNFYKQKQWNAVVELKKWIWTLKIETLGIDWGWNES